MRTSEIVIACVLVFWLILGVALVASGLMGINPCEASEPPKETWSPPNVQLCLDDLGLWECISTVAYREDI